MASEQSLTTQEMDKYHHNLLSKSYSNHFPKYLNIKTNPFLFQYQNKSFLFYKFVYGISIQFVQFTNNQKKNIKKKKKQKLNKLREPVT